ncbi:MAG: hypothetical protein Q7U20_04180 [Caulobacter sp.]|nr:hypothetical protein [Caulobacter sp.]
MATSRKTPDDDTSSMAQSPGVEETGAVFDAPVRDRWTIARARLAEFRRTGISLDAETVLNEFVASVKDRVADKT